MQKRRGVHTKVPLLGLAKRYAGLLAITDDKFKTDHNQARLDHHWRRFIRALKKEPTRDIPQMQQSYSNQKQACELIKDKLNPNSAADRKKIDTMDQQLALYQKIMEQKQKPPSVQTQAVQPPPPPRPATPKIKPPPPPGLPPGAKPTVAADIEFGEASSTRSFLSSTSDSFANGFNRVDTYEIFGTDSRPPSVQIPEQKITIESVLQNFRDALKQTQDELVSNPVNQKAMHEILNQLSKETHEQIRAIANQYPASEVKSAQNEINGKISIAREILPVATEQVVFVEPFQIAANDEIIPATSLEPLNETDFKEKNLAIAAVKLKSQEPGTYLFWKTSLENTLGLSYVDTNGVAQHVVFALENPDDLTNEKALAETISALLNIRLTTPLSSIQENRTQDNAIYQQVPSSPYQKIPSNPVSPYGVLPISSTMNTYSLAGNYNSVLPPSNETVSNRVPSGSGYQTLPVNPYESIPNEWEGELSTDEDTEYTAILAESEFEDPSTLSIDTDTRLSQIPYPTTPESSRKTSGSIVPPSTGSATSTLITDLLPATPRPRLSRKNSEEKLTINEELRRKHVNLRWQELMETAATMSSEDFAARVAALTSIKITKTDFIETAKQLLQALQAHQLNPEMNALKVCETIEKAQRAMLENTQLKPNEQFGKDTDAVSHPITLLKDDLLRHHRSAQLTPKSDGG